MYSRTTEATVVSKIPAPITSAAPPITALPIPKTLSPTLKPVSTTVKPEGPTFVSMSPLQAWQSASDIDFELDATKPKPKPKSTTVTTTAMDASLQTPLKMFVPKSLDLSTPLVTPVTIKPPRNVLKDVSNMKSLDTVMVLKGIIKLPRNKSGKSSSNLKSKKKVTFGENSELEISPLEHRSIRLMESPFHSDQENITPRHRGNRGNVDNSNNWKRSIGTPKVAASRTNSAVTTPRRVKTRTGSSKSGTQRRAIAGRWH